MTDIREKIKKLTEAWKKLISGEEEYTDEDKIDFEKARELLEKRYNLTEDDIRKLVEKNYNLDLQKAIEYMKRSKNDKD